MRQNLGLSYFVLAPILFHKITTLTCKSKYQQYPIKFPYQHKKIKYQN